MPLEGIDLNVYELLIIIFTSIGAISTLLYYIISFKYKKNMDARAISQQISEKVKQDAREYSDAKNLEIKKELAYTKETIVDVAVEKAKEEMRDYIDKGDLDVKRELAYAIKLVCKDITFLQQFVFGKESKSLPAYLMGRIETREHDEKEGEGIFRDTEEEEYDRRRRNRKGNGAV